jgi:hypothetical protein
LEQNDAWQLQHRYMQVEAMAELFSPASEAGTKRSQPPHDHASCQTDCGVIGANAKRATAGSPSSPAAA